MNKVVQATLRLGNGDLHVVRPGDLIGRLWRADLSIDDPAVSEAHALVTLRGGALKIRRLGGPLRVSGMPATEIELREGIRLSLAPDIVFEVVSVTLPDEFPALVVGESPPFPLLADRYSLRSDGSLAQGEHSGEALFWNNGENWFVSSSDECHTKLMIDDCIKVAGHRLRLQSIRRHSASTPETQHQAIYKPIRMVARWDAVHIHQEERPILTFSGGMAKLIRELASLDGPAPWHVVACEIWPTLTDSWEVLRRRWDKTLEKIRAKLRKGNVRPDLIRSGSGHVSLALLNEDLLDVEL